MQVGVGTQVVTTVETGVVNVLVTQCSVPMQASASPHPPDAVEVASVGVRTWRASNLSKLLVHTSGGKLDQDSSEWFGEKHIESVVVGQLDKNIIIRTRAELAAVWVNKADL